MALCSLSGLAPMQAVLEEKERSLNIILKLWDVVNQMYAGRPTISQS